MSAPQFETVLARLYCEREFREAFLKEPLAALAASGLTESEQAALAGIDRLGLELAARSFDAKKTKRRRGSFLLKIRLLRSFGLRVQ